MSWLSFSLQVADLCPHESIWARAGSDRFTRTGGEQDVIGARTDRNSFLHASSHVRRLEAVVKDLLVVRRRQRHHLDIRK
jgi:hypothetical protein